MADRAKIGIIGVGQIGNMHLQRYRKLPVEIVAAADINEAALARAAQEYEIARTFTDFRSLLEIDEIQAESKSTAVRLYGASPKEVTRRSSQNAHDAGY